MYIQCPRIVAGVLLLYPLLHSCGDPYRRLLGSEEPQAGIRTNQSKQVKNLASKPRGFCKSLPKYSTSTFCRGSSYESPGEKARVFSTVLPGTLRGEFGQGLPDKAPQDNTPQHNHYVSSSRLSQTPATYQQPLRVGLHLDLRKVGFRQVPQLSRFYSVFPIVSTKPEVARLELPARVGLSTPQAAACSQTTSSLITALQAPIGPLALSSGKTVIFSQVDGQWRAKVKEVEHICSSEQSLPVVCKGDLSTALHNLKGYTGLQRKWHLHIINAALGPGAPKCVYVGHMGLRGGMKQEKKQPPKRAGTVHTSHNRTRVVVGMPNLPIDENTGQKTPSFFGNELSAVCHPYTVARVASTPTLAHSEQDHLQSHRQNNSEALLLADVPAPHDIMTNIEEDAKMPSLPCSTIFSNLAAAQEAVSSYLIRWQLETASGRDAIREQGKNILKGVEKLKKATKRSYRQQVLGFETQDVDPLVWNRVLQAQKATQSQLNALRSLSAQLVSVCQIRGQELRDANIRITTSEATGELELYSSDEDTQQISDQDRKNHAAFVAGIGKVLQKRTAALAEKILGHSLGTVEDYVQLFMTIPGFPDILKEYIQAFLQEKDEEKRAELLGSLLTEAILQFLPISESQKTQLNKIEKKLGKAAQQVASLSCNQLNKLAKQEKGT